MPRVTVILSSLNHAKFIAAAIESVLNQTFGDFELFIVDDASEDNSWDIIQQYKDKRIVAMRNSKRMRGAYGFNEIIEKRARGEYIAIHHSDDLFHSTKLEKQTAFLDAHPGVGAVFTQVDVIDEHGEPFADAEHFYSSAFRQKNRSRFEWLRHFFFKGNSLCHPSVLARRSAYLSIGLYDRRLGQITDFDLWIRMCLQYEIHILDEPLVKFRVRDGEANQSGHRVETIVRGRNELLQVLRNFSRIESVQELHLVFPELSKRYEVGTPPNYQLALLALESDGDVAQAFGLDLLYASMADKEIATELEQYGFSYMDFVALTGGCDFFKSAYLFRVESELRTLHVELLRVKSTISWRVTGLFRVPANLWRHFQNWLAEIS